MNQIFNNVIELTEYLRGKGYPEPQEKAKKVLFKHNGAISKTDLKTLYCVVWDLEDIKTNNPKEVLMKDETYNYGETILFILENNWARKVRLKVFESEDIPFKSYSKAIEWIDSICSEFLENYIEKYSKKEMLFSSKYDELIQLIKSGDAIGSVMKPYLSLPYKEEKINDIDCLIIANINHSKELQYIQFEIEQMENLLGISKYELLKYLLSGIKPKLKRYEVIKNKGLRESITINIYVSDLNFKEMKQIYDQYREVRNVKKQKQLTDKQKMIVALIDDMGPPPNNKGTSAFYKNVLNAWNIKHPDMVYASWQALYKAYENTKLKLNRM